jgi:hypothetical protein
MHGTRSTTSSAPLFSALNAESLPDYNDPVNFSKLSILTTPIFAHRPPQNKEFLNAVDEF